ncbi:RES family NAD+ phosphorylase [Niabella hirudinis]|uniref:RES family NAD+ phosphorylase n=1 Tax=Niabella hirudinis TaxID=1285929 RepID=UPI003EC0918D
MLIYRIAQEPFAMDLSGKGAWMSGGRWNNEGHFALYTSASRALALLEILAHTPAKMLTVKPYILLTLEVADTQPTDQVSLGMLPADWNLSGSAQATAQLGDLFLKRSKALLLMVPSIIMPEEWNYVLNPLHPDMKKVRIVHRRNVTFDKRLF